MPTTTTFPIPDGLGASALDNQGTVSQSLPLPPQEIGGGCFVFHNLTEFHTRPTLNVATGNAKKELESKRNLRFTRRVQQNGLECSVFKGFSDKFNDEEDDASGGYLMHLSTPMRKMVT
ncbi:hypothetical protein AYO21_11461 [Fonsecaea monophora]|uniref:Uncharacterized protein n=1 Tax=Fonsecaea monophora TaxID=254056 RepID=A0A177EQT1_9EURO|nr:hypothetical protein AYO21_11461 [Fonsecaea monophora]OAG34375.1 hypothetical protein AYO21_11461 [Fonsecaea monophora]